MSARGFLISAPLVMGLIVQLAAGAVHAGSDPSSSQVARIRVMNHNGKPLSAGEVEFFRADVFVTRCSIGSDGYISLDRSLLKSGERYRISVLDTDLDEIYATEDWLYNAADFDAEWDSGVGLDKYEVAVVLKGVSEKALSMNVDRKVSSRWQKAKDATRPATVQAGVGNPIRYIGTASVVFMFGNFGADESALAGIPSADPGLSLSFGYRYGYPADMDSRNWATYREIVIGYGQNRYTTNQVNAPGEQSDVAYHRVTVGWGIGRTKARHDMSAAVAVDLGGIYDGGNKLEYLDRTYGLFGIGARGRYIFGLAAHVGLVGDVELMYYPADNQENDHWYGLAPSIAIGAAIY